LGILDLYSKRQKRLRGESPDVYQYSELPSPFRVQATLILTDVFSNPMTGWEERQRYFRMIHDALAREYGMFKLSKRLDHTGDYQTALFEFFGTAEVEQALDVIEVSFRVANWASEGDSHRYSRLCAKLKPSQGIEELNERFKEHGIGFQFESNQIIRVDSQFLHQETIKPALRVLSARRFAGANDEFLSAHEHYRSGRYAEAVNECLKALESTLKVICQTRRWPFKETDTAKTLLDIVFANNLIPDYMQSQFGGLRSVLESGVPTTRSRESAHGAGATPRAIPAHLAAYVLHQTAASILFLAEAEKQLA
jgi:hypothetical protein